MLADGDPAWLVAWRDRDRQPAPSPPAKVYAPKDTYLNESIQTYSEFFNSVTEALAK